MARLANPLIFDLLDIADALAKQGGRPNLRQAAARRAVSSAYYAVFHALCTVCVGELAGWRHTDLVDRTYRSLDHATARRRLAHLSSGSETGSQIRQLGLVFGELQDKRHLADYARPGSLFSEVEAVALIAEARNMVAILASMSRDERRALAIDLLVVKSR